MVFLVETLVIEDAGKWLLDTAWVYHIDVRLQRWAKLENFYTMLALLDSLPHVRDHVSLNRILEVKCTFT
jgi:hypothetical protein